jgi:ABC-type glutathione transport system ATPase component
MDVDNTHNFFDENVPPPPEDLQVEYRPPPVSETKLIFEFIQHRREGMSETDSAEAIRQGRDPFPEAPHPEASVINAGPFMDSEGNPVPQEASADQPPPPGQQEGSGVAPPAVNIELSKNEVIHVATGDRWKVFKHPAQIVIAGPTMSGKTTLVRRILTERQRMFDPPPKQVYWFYQMASSVAGLRDSLGSSVRFQEGFPQEDTVATLIDDRPKLIVLDDMQHVLEKTGVESILNLFRVQSHHGNLSVIFIAQSYVGKNMKSIRDQCSDIIVMGKGANATNAVKTAAQQVLGAGSQKFIEMCLTKTRERSTHPHLLLSTTTDTPPVYVSTGITPGDPTQTFFARAGEASTKAFDELKEHAAQAKREAAQGGPATH